MQPVNDNNFRDIRLLAGAASLALLAFHYYYYCYRALAGWELTYPILDRITAGIARSGLFHHQAVSKLIALAALAATNLGTQQATQTTSRRRLFITFAAGLLLLFAPDILLTLHGTPATLASLYILFTLSGLILLYIAIRGIISQLTWSSRSDIFNRYNESFPQEERLLKNPYSINLKARYTYRNQIRNSHINLIEIFAGTLIMGRPGSGKTRFIFRQMIQQSLANGMAVFIYDLKYDDLSRLAYNTLLNLKGKLLVQPEYFSISFDNLSFTHQCNPIDPSSLDDISDAAESSRTFLLALNKKWIHKQGDFFVESAIGFFTANIWFLRLYEDGKYCTLAHLIELIQTDFPKLFSILRSYPTTETLIGSYVSAYQSNTMEQLQGQVDSARIALSSIISPRLYYILCANDFTLDLNNPDAPKVICIGSNPQKQHIYGAIISLYVSRMLKLVNRKGAAPCHLFFDESASLYTPGMDLCLAQARQNKVAVTLGIQDLSQLRKEYGRDQADALFNLPGNIISSQVTGDSARLVSERFGKTLQQKSTVSSNDRGTSTSETMQLDLMLPASKISNLSSGEFVGITADTPSQPIQLKGFHCHIIVDHAAIEKEEASYQPLPQVRTVTKDLVDYNFLKIKEDVKKLVDTRLAQMMQNPILAKLIVVKNQGFHRRQAPGNHN